PYFEVCRKEIMRSMLSEAADWFTVKADKKKADDEPAPKKTPAIPPMQVVEDVLAQRAWPGLPPVIAITQTPVFIPGGKLVSEPGYNREGMHWLDSGGFDLPDVPEQPTTEDVAAAKAMLDELLCDFPFVGEAGKANAVAMLLLPYVRPMIAGPTPL